MDNYTNLLDRISRAANLTNEEIERKIEAKRAKLSGLISKEGAAQIVAAELGIVFDNALLKLSELVEGMKRAHVLGKVTQVFPVRSYHKNGREGKIGSFLLGDASSNVRVVLWDAHHIDLIEQGTLKEGHVYEIFNAGFRNGELHLGAFSDLKPSGERLSDVKTDRTYSRGTFKDAQAGGYVSTRATIVQLFDPKFFEAKDGSGEQRALLNIVLDDGSESMRAVLGMQMMSELGIPRDELVPEKFSAHKERLLGEELIFIGSYKMNTYFNRLEMNVQHVQPLVLDVLIKELDG